MAKKIIKQPTADEQRMLKEVTSAEASYVMVRGKRWKVEWMRNGTLDYVSRVLLRRSRMLEKVASRFNRDGIDGAATEKMGAATDKMGTANGKMGAATGKMGADADEMAAATREADAYEKAYSYDPVKIGGEENKVVCKCAALMRLNGYWAIKLLYWFVWRWFYYVKQYSEGDLGEYIAECKKKVPVMDYLMCTTLLTAMMDTKKQMNRAEVNRIQVEQLSAQRAALAKNTQN